MARRDGYSRGLESLEEIRASDRFIEQLRVSGTYEPSTRADAALAAALLSWRDEARLDPLNPPPSADEVDLDGYAQPRRIARRAVAVAAAMLALSSAAATALDGDPLKPVRFLVDLGVNVGERIGHPNSDPSSAEGVDAPTITSSEDGTGSGPGDSPLLGNWEKKLLPDGTPHAPNPDVSPTAPDAGTEPPPSVTATDEPPAVDGTETTPPPVTETTPPPDSGTETTPPDNGQGETTPPTGDPGETSPPPDSGNDNPSDPQGGVVDGGLDGGGQTSDSTPGGDENGTNSGDTNTSNDGSGPPVTSPDDPSANPPGNPENQGDQNGGNGQGNGDENGNGDGSQSAQDSLDFHGTWPLTGIDPYGLVPFDQPGNSEKSHGNGHAYGHFFKQLNKHERTALKQYKHLNKHEIAAFKKHLDKRERALFNKYLRQFGYTGAAWDGWGHGSVRWRSS